jgi:hypothetical protein
MEKNVFWFQITVNEAHKVEILQSRSDFRGIKASGILGDALARASLQS